MTHLKFSLQKLALKTVFHPFFLTSTIVTKYPYTFHMYFFPNSIITAVSYSLWVLTEKCKPLFCV